MKKKKANSKQLSSALINGILVLIFLLGVGLLAYPSVSDWWNSFHQTRAVASYIETVADLSSEEYEKLWNAAVAYNEIYSAMQNNVIDAAENDIANILNMKFYEPAPYITLTEHDFATRFLVCSAMKYNSLTDEQKAWVDEASEYAAEIQWEYDYDYSETCRAQLEEQGAKFIEFDSSEMAEIATPILGEIAEKLGVTEGYDLIKAAG